MSADNTWSGGCSDVMQGIVVADTPAPAAKLATAYEALGPTVGADDAYLALRGVRTLPVRLAQHRPMRPRSRSGCGASRR